MFGVDNRVGRLIETTASSLDTPEEIAAFNSRFREITGRLAATQVMICADFRRLRSFSPDLADRFSSLLSIHNVRVARGAILCAPQHAEVCAQLQRAVEAANNPMRRAFNEPADAIEWLGQVLTDDERNRLIDFLAAGR